MLIDFTGIVAVACLLLGSRLVAVGVSRGRGGLPISFRGRLYRSIAGQSVASAVGLLFSLRARGGVRLVEFLFRPGADFIQLRVQLADSGFEVVEVSV